MPITRPYPIPVVRSVSLIALLVLAGLPASLNAQPPTNVSVSPSGQTGATQSFTFSASSPGGYANIENVHMMADWAIWPIQSCYILYTHSSNTLMLMNDAGTGWLTPVTPQTSGTVANSQCTVNATASSVSGSGNNLSVTVSITFQPAYFGPQNLYMIAMDNTGLNSGWQQMGTWTGYAAPSSSPPVSVSVTPNAGTGMSATFSFAGSSVNGAGYLPELVLSLSGQVQSANSCLILYYSPWNTVYLMNDGATDWAAPITPGAAGTLENSQCRIDGAGSVVNRSGNNLTLGLAVTFKAAYTGSKNLWMLTFDHSGQNSGWQNLGTWNANTPAAQPPSNVSVSPSGQTGATQSFTFTASSPNGNANIENVHIMADWAIWPIQSCYILYTRSSNTLMLMNDAGSGWLTPVTPQTSATAANSQCTIYAAYSSVSGSGNNLSVTVSITFQPAYFGPQNLYMIAMDNAGLNSGWQQMGTWTGYTALSSSPPVSVSVTPNAGTGMSATFSFAGSSANGAAYIPELVMGIGGTQQANNCYILYYSPWNTVYLMNDAGTVWTGPITLGTAGTVENLQCRIDGVGSAVNRSGDNLTLGLAVTFKAGYTGSKNLWMLTFDHSGQNSGWQSLGSWAVGVPLSTVATVPAGLALTVDGTACTTPCTFPWTAGTSHTIAAAATQAGTAGTQFVLQSAASQTVTAASTPTTYTVSYQTQYYLVTNAGAGGTISPPSGWNDAGSPVTVSAIANASYYFTGFTGDLSGTVSQQTLWMTAPKSAAAGFAVMPVSTVTSSPSAMSISVDGASCTTPCTFQWIPATSHTLFAGTVAGATGMQYRFGSWNVGTSASQAVTAASSATTYTASFITQYYLTTGAGGGGSISPASGWYDSGSVVGVSAIPNTAYQFTAFSGALTGATTPQNVTMTAAAAVSASFLALPTTTIQSVPAGLQFAVDSAACLAPCTFHWLPGASHTISAGTQINGTSTQYVFASWDPAGNATRTITAPSANTTYTASFTAQYAVSGAAGPATAGNVLLSPPGGWYSAGTQVTASASANSGWAFAGFTGVIVNTVSPQAFTVNAPVNLTANFIPDFSLTTAASVTTEAGGTVSFTVTVTSQNGAFNDTVTFDPPTLPTGATASFNPPSVTGTGSSTVTIHAPPNGGTFNFTLSGTAASSGLSRPAGGNLVVQDFTLMPVNTTANAAVGNGISTLFQWAVAGINGFNDSVRVSHVQIVDPQTLDPLSQTSQTLANGCPFNNWTTDGSADNVTLYIVPNASCNSGTNGYTYTLLLHFRSSTSSIIHTAVAGLSVSAAGSFSVTVSPVNPTVVPGATVTYSIGVGGTGNFNGQVSFTTPLPSCATNIVAPSAVTSGGSTTLQFNTSNCAVGNTYPISISGYSATGNITKFVDASLTVQASSAPPDFSIKPSPNTRTVLPNGGDVYTLNVAGINGFNQFVTLAAGTLPAGVTVSFPAGSTVTGSGTLPVRVSAGPSAASGSFTITATGGGLVRSTTLTINVVSPQPDFTISDIPIATVPANGTVVAVPIAISQLNNRTGPITLRAVGSSLPMGLSITFSGQTMMLAAPTGIPVGDYAFLVEGNGGAGGGGTHNCGGSIRVSGGGGSGGGGVVVVHEPVISHISSTDGRQDPATLIGGTSADLTITGQYFGTIQGYLLMCQSAHNPYDHSLNATPCYPTGMTSGPSSLVQDWFDGIIHATVTMPAGAIGDWKLWVRSANWVSGATEYNGPGTLTVYDGTPVISELEQSEPAGGPITLHIKGLNFGSATVSGTVVVCALATSTTGCSQTPDFTVGQVIWGAVITAVLTPSLGNSPGPYCVQVTRNGTNGNPFVAAPNGGSAAWSVCKLLLTATVSLTPADVSGDPGDVFTFTASSTGGTGSYLWSIGGGTQPGDDPTAFRFVSPSCTSGITCPAITPDSCFGAQSCTVHVQSTSTGFANVGVAFQTQFAASPQQSARDRAITVEITKIWSDQFPDGPVANYLPGDGTLGSGAGAGLVGNARQLLIVGAGQYHQAQYDNVTNVLYAYIKANVITVPSGQEALDHILVRLQEGVPALPGEASMNPNPLKGSGSASGSVFSVNILAPAYASDYSVVAGVDIAGKGQGVGTLTGQQRVSPFRRTCLIAPDPGTSACSNGAVRIVSLLEYTVDKNMAGAGADLNVFFDGYSGFWPTAGRFLRAFAAGVPPTDATHNPTPESSRIDTSQLYFNDGVVLDNASGQAQRYGGPVNAYTFPVNSTVTSKIWESSDFRELIGETLQAHKADVAKYFVDNPGASSYESPPWQAIGCWSLPNANLNCAGLPSSTLNTGSRVDEPPLFPCATSAGQQALPSGVSIEMLQFPGKTCDLTFWGNADLHNAFGRVGYDFTIRARVSRANAGVVTSVSLSGQLYDFYQWNPAKSNLDYRAANIQAGFSTLGQGGRVYKIRVQLDTNALVSSNEELYQYTFR